MKKEDTTWRDDFEARLRAQHFGTSYDVLIHNLIATLLDSADWEHDHGDDDLFTLEGQLMREGESLAEELWHTFFHQNTRYPRSLAAVPFLSEMLPHVAPANQLTLIHHLVYLGLGDPGWHLDYGFRPERTRGAGMTVDLGIALHSAVQTQAVPHFLRLARESSHAHTRAAALWALGWFPACADEAKPILQRAAKHDTNALARDCARFALRLLQAAADQPGDLNDTSWGDPGREICREHEDLEMRFLGVN